MRVIASKTFQFLSVACLALAGCSDSEKGKDGLNPENSSKVTSTSQPTSGKKAPSKEQSKSSPSAKPSPLVVSDLLQGDTYAENFRRQKENDEKNSQVESGNETAVDRPVIPKPVQEPPFPAEPTNRVDADVVVPFAENNPSFPSFEIFRFEGQGGINSGHLGHYKVYEGTEEGGDKCQLKAYQISDSLAQREDLPLFLQVQVIITLEKVGKELSAQDRGLNGTAFLVAEKELRKINFGAEDQLIGWHHPFKVYRDLPANPTINGVKLLTGAKIKTETQLSSKVSQDRREMLFEQRHEYYDLFDRGTAQDGEDEEGQNQEPILRHEPKLKKSNVLKIVRENGLIKEASFDEMVEGKSDFTSPFKVVCKDLREKSL